MLVTKLQPVGIDIPIQKMQEYLHTRLVDRWNLVDDTEYRCHGRCYRNKTSDGYIAENYEGGGQYKEVYWDSQLSALSFFGTGTTTDVDTGKQVAAVHLVFFVDLAKVKPGITHRADEEVRKDVQTAIGNGMFGFTWEGIQTGIENVLREYPGSRRDERLKYIDMHPVHCFRIDYTLRYAMNIQNC